MQSICFNANINLDVDDCGDGSDEDPSCGHDECSLSANLCSQVCNEKPIGYDCSCNPGYKLADDKRNCISMTIVNVDYL
jgi:hypothetical protein